MSLTTRLWSLDSTKIRFPLFYNYKMGEDHSKKQKLPQIIEPLLSERYYNALINAETGEIVPTGDFKSNSFRVDTPDGVKTKYAIEHLKTSFEGANSEPKPYLVIMFNAKLLGADYLQGITADNIQRVYSALMSQGVVHIPLETFLYGECTDTDFKRDFACTSDRLIQNHINQLQRLTESTPEKNEGCHVWRQQKNLGIEWGNRSTATVANPYIKFYEKSRELLHNSTLFAMSYGVEVPENTLRMEYTIKGKNYLSSGAVPYRGVNYGFDKSTKLIDLLRLSDEVLGGLGNYFLKKHLIKGAIMKQKKTGGKTPTDMAMTNLMVYMHENYGVGVIEFIQIATEGMDKKAKYRTKNKILSLWEEIEGADSCAIESETYDFLEELELV